jgi:signal transduction histidine kinase
VPEPKHILQRWPSAPAWVVFAALYAVSSWVGMRLTPAGHNFSAIWPASGVLLTALLLARWRHWPVLVVTAILVEPFASAPGHWPSPGTLLLSADNSLEALVGAFALRRWMRLRPSLERLRDVLGLLGLTVLLCPVVSATPGATLLVLHGQVTWPEWWREWRVFWVGDAMGVLLMAPPLLCWGVPGRVRWSRARQAELLLLLLGLMGTVHLAFEWAPETQSPHHPLTYAAFPFILWAALRFEARGTSLALLALATVAVSHTLMGNGPFALFPDHDSTPATTATRLLFLQSFLAAVGGSGWMLSAAVSEQRHAREKIEQLHRELQESQRELVRRERLAAVGQLAASMAHEVGNPLGVLANAVAALVRHHLPLGNSTFSALVTAMGEEVARLDLLIKTLVEFALPSAPQLTAQPLAPLVEEALHDALDASAAPVCITVTRALDPAVPEAPFDAQLLHRALSNLFLNALQAMPQGGVLRVELSRDEPAEGPPQARIAITDTGSGIPPEVMRRLFEPFFTTKALGAGLGLAIVRGIVEAHHGQVDVHSTPGQGSTFTVRLPLVRPGL